MKSSALRRSAGRQLRQSMMGYPDCCVPTCWVGNQAGSTRCSISLEEASNSGLPVTPEGVGDWRCLAVEKLSQVELSAEAWHTEPRSRRQTCVDEVDFDADDQPDEDPQ